MTDDSPNVNHEREEQSTEQIADGGESAVEQSLSVVESRPTALSDNGLVMVPWQGLLIASLAGLVVWGMLEIVMPVFELPEHLRELHGNISFDEAQALREGLALVRARNSSLSLVLFACTMGLVLAVAELLFRRDPLRAVWGGLLAGLVAGVIANGAAAVGGALINSLDMGDNRLVKTMIVQSAALGMMGLGIGVGISLPMFRLRLLGTCVAGCLVGGLLAALVFPLAVGILFQNVNTEFLIPEPGVGRILWIGLAACLIGATVSGLGKGKKIK